MLGGKLALVTGAASGIGLAVAKLFAQQGASVIMVDLSETVKSMMNELHKADDTVTHSAYTCDVSKSDQVNELFNNIKQQYPILKAPNIVINSDEILEHELFLNLSEDTFDRVISVNLKGTYLVAQAAAKALVENFHNVILSTTDTYATIINISSVAAISGHEYCSHYCASKAAVEGMTRSIARELAKYKIRCNCVTPGFIDTPLNHTTLLLDPLLKNTFVSTLPMRRCGKASEIAQVCLFIASDMGSYLTGESILCDGGMLS